MMNQPVLGMQSMVAIVMPISLTHITHHLVLVLEVPGGSSW
jgi:hypothetical protein